MRPAECFILSKREAAFSTQAEARHGTKLTQNRNHLQLMREERTQKNGLNSKL